MVRKGKKSTGRRNQIYQTARERPPHCVLVRRVLRVIYMTVRVMGQKSKEKAAAVITTKRARDRRLTA